MQPLRTVILNIYDWGLLLGFGVLYKHELLRALNLAQRTPLRRETHTAVFTQFSKLCTDRSLITQYFSCAVLM